MSLQFSAAYTLLADTIEFYGWDGDQLITCSVRIAAISRRFGVPMSDEIGIRSAFLAHQKELHRLARANHAAELVSADGKLRVRNIDLLPPSQGRDQGARDSRRRRRPWPAVRSGRSFHSARELVAG
jgi:Protein of unknown function (DUF1488)